MNTLSALTYEELFEALKGHVAREHAESVQVIAYLAEVARRHAHVTAACRSLAVYCEERLGLPHYEAQKRATVAYMVLDYPVILEMLERRQVCISSLLILRPALSADNYAGRLQEAAGKTVLQVERLVAGWKPKDLVATKVFAVKVDDRQQRLEDAIAMRAAPASTMTTEPPQVPAPQQLPPPPPAPRPRPLDANHYKLQLTIDAETYEDLMRLRALTRHSVPDGDIAKVVSRAVKAHLKAVEKKKLGRTDKPRQLAIPDGTERAPDKSSAPGAATRREVSERDGDQCRYVAPDGKRCTAKEWLEYDHKITRADGGETSTKNMRHYCRVHNQARNFEDHGKGGTLIKNRDVAISGRRCDSQAEAHALLAHD